GGGHEVFYQVGGLLLVLGALVVGLRIGAGWLGVRRLLRAAPKVRDPQWLTLLHDAQRELGVRRPVRLLRSHRSGTPLCAGTLHPAIVLPRQAQSWSAERRRLVLLHELAHIRRYDCLTQLVAQAACALHLRALRATTSPWQCAP
ncbi:MAG TPA: M56 family metallopeptidase, partial [Pseudomonadota bacterium]|nr:M56 family metallopeptidase [Pseudomonadota bacterium]